MNTGDKLRRFVNACSAKKAKTPRVNVVINEYDIFQQNNCYIYGSVACNASVMGLRTAFLLTVDKFPAGFKAREHVVTVTGRQERSGVEPSTLGHALQSPITVLIVRGNPLSARK